MVTVWDRAKAEAEAAKKKRADSETTTTVTLPDGETIPFNTKAEQEAGAERIVESFGARADARGAAPDQSPVDVGQGPGSAFRRGGAFVAAQWSGDMPDPGYQKFAEGLRARRFRTIENAASEEVSVGWVTPGDPTGETFAIEDMDGGEGTWLRFRVDVKKMPTAWLQMHIEAAQRARGRKLSARERRELKDGLAEKILPRVLPSTTHVDALLFHERKLLLLFSTSAGARDLFAKLVFESFAVPIDYVGPLELARRLLPAAVPAIDGLQPTRWPVAKGGGK